MKVVGFLSYTVKGQKEQHSVGKGIGPSGSVESLELQSPTQKVLQPASRIMFSPNLTVRKEIVMNLYFLGFSKQKCFSGSLFMFSQDVL